MPRKLVRLHDQLNNAEEESIDTIIGINPTILDVNDSDVIEVGNYYLPYSTGFEIECFKHEIYEEECFTSIPDILDVNNDNNEQRYRIPSGIKGLICLFRICNQLEINNIPTDSGIHYHVDCTDLVEDKLYKFENFQPFEQFILTELDTWGYKGTYNSRQFSSGSSWVRLNQYHKTIEFRIGEMSFNYKTLLKRILHLNGIMKYIKNELYKQYLMENAPSLKYEQEGSIEEILRNRNKRL